MTYKAHGHRVTLEPIKEEGETVSNGIIIPSTASTNWPRAKVLSVGHADIDLNVGDIVLYEPYRVSELASGVIIVPSEAIIATVII